MRSRRMNSPGPLLDLKTRSLEIYGKNRAKRTRGYRADVDLFDATTGKWAVANLSQPRQCVVGANAGLPADALRGAVITSLVQDPTLCLLAAFALSVQVLFLIFISFLSIYVQAKQTHLALTLQTYSTPELDCGRHMCSRNAGPLTSAHELQHALNIVPQV